MMIRRHARRVLDQAVAAGASGRPPTRAEVLILAAGPVVEGLALRMTEKLADAGGAYELARDPLAPPSAGAHRFVVLGAQVVPDDQSPGRLGAVLSAMQGLLSPPLLAAMGPRLVSLAAREIPLARWLEADAEALLDAVKPRVVVDFHFLPRLATPYLVAARRRGIRTVCCQHGLIPSLDYDSPWYDEYLLFNEYTAEVVRPRVGEGARLTVVGNPTLDALAGWQPQSPSAPNERPTVLLATQPNDPPGSDAREDWWFAVLARACAAVGAEAWVKLHPQQKPEREGEMYRRAMAKAGCEGRIIAHGTADLRDLIAACDVFVSQFSTTILEALALGKPVVFVELREGPPFYPFDDFGAAIRVTRPDDAEPALRRAMSDEGRAQMQAARAEFSTRHLEPWDGHALERMAQAILAE
jgi:UDP-N-acetylglucosamine:LPS N-acetylglucosamine transferase